MNEEKPDQSMEQKCPQCGAPLPSGVLAGLCPACLFKQGAAADTAVPQETAPFQPPGVREVAQLFPQLEILGFIGKGGMGAVYKARQPALDRLVALKILPPQTAGGSGFVERFNREARALAKLSHPNIVALYEFGQVNGLPFFIMEFVDGLNLRELERAGKLSPREALKIVPQICEALQFAHDEGIVHRDIKPENILLDKKGRVKIADFGIAKVLGRESDVDLTQTKGAIGTPHYMAPEQMEKPTTVDHRADIFSLGVVFYEMLTGELPLGKFAPPSSRKVEVDVRLDDVVLRALERDPDRRYQHVSQVKSAVDTIASSAGSPPPGASATAMAHGILARDYNLEIGSCVRRGWSMLKAEFWPLVGVTALLLALLGFATTIGGESLRHGPMGVDSAEITSGLAMIVWGPLVGGLLFYFLKKVRKETATVETAFTGFSKHFLHLFLAGFVTSLLTWIGFFCLVLPGIYLMVAWMFALPLVVDKHLDFWSAMELSRKVVTKHWFKFLLFGIVMTLLIFAGAMAFGFGIFVAMPLVIAAFMYAYQDVFCNQEVMAIPAVAGVGPSGTILLPAAQAAPPRPGGGWWTPRKSAVAAMILVLGLVVVLVITNGVRRHRERAWQAQEVSETPAVVQPEDPVVNASALAFGPVMEREIQTRDAGTNEFLDLENGQLLTLPTEISNVLKGVQPGEDAGRLWQALDIPSDSRRFQYISWLRENSADLMFAGDGKLIGFDGIFAAAHGESATNWDDWDALTAEQVQAATVFIEATRKAAEPQMHGKPVPMPISGGRRRSAAQLNSSEPGGPIVNLLTRDQSENWFFKTRNGAMGIMQITGFTNDPPIATIRYKLLQKTNDEGGIIVGSAALTHETLSVRLNAASQMSNREAKDKSAAVVALDAARAGDLKIVEESLGQISDSDNRNQAALESVRLLAKRGQRKQALEIAQYIDDQTIRDQALSELAQ